ncbi:single-stranded DNA-binding protein [Streptomyces sp. FIT100]|uniref:single-stranded DNA-binding protein n=1 Tax=Streptomyces sp. FIT100 TaxID=2837956 RepID=UPI0021C84752|nr:single-stranded DNA-binding protein [Streptomyces sp. FIT100]UUN26964.1 single-stranded DNA-binding protein [Streptomyces sp. FIT100]
MNETTVTLVGNVATAVEYRESESGGYARFRFAVTSRRWDRLRELWADGPTSFYTVWASRTLGLNLAASVSVGEPLVVHGRLKVREEERDGVRRSSAVVDAVAAGHDLTRGTSAFRRAAKGDPYPSDRSPGRSGAPGAANAGEQQADGAAPGGPAPVAAGAVPDAAPAPPF